MAATPRNRSQIFDLVEVFRARIVDLTSESLMIEMTGVESKIEGLIEVLREDEGRILEICRSGKMTMRRGHHTSGVLKSHGHRRRDEPRDSVAEDSARRAGIADDRCCEGAAVLRRFAFAALRPTATGSPNKF